MSTIIRAFALVALLMIFALFIGSMLADSIHNALLVAMRGKSF